MKQTKIICSIGPASCTTEVMTKMVDAGMNVARINFSHATDEEKENVVKTVKEEAIKVFELKVQEFSNDEIASKLNTDKRNVENALFRIRKKMNELKNN